MVHAQVLSDHIGSGMTDVVAGQIETEKICRQKKRFGLVERLGPQNFQPLQINGGEQEFSREVTAACSVFMAR